MSDHILFPYKVSVSDEELECLNKHRTAKLEQSLENKHWVWMTTPQKAAAIREAEQRVLKAASDFALFADIARGRHAAKLYATLSELKALGWEPES